MSCAAMRSSTTAFTDGRATVLTSGGGIPPPKEKADGSKLMGWATWRELPPSKISRIRVEGRAYGGRGAAALPSICCSCRSVDWST
jgi:hypothetical protein